MKTEREVEALKLSIQEKISDTSAKASEAWQEGNERLFNHYGREYVKYIAQYNILLEVLRG